MEKLKFPIVFVMDTKRGSTYQERRLEACKEKLYYIDQSKLCLTRFIYINQYRNEQAEASN